MDRISIEQFVSNRNLNFAKNFKAGLKEDIENHDKIIFWILAATLSSLGFLLTKAIDYRCSLYSLGLPLFSLVGIVTIILIIVYKILQLHHYNLVILNEYAVSENLTTEITYYFNTKLTGNEDAQTLAHIIKSDFGEDIPEEKQELNAMKEYHEELAKYYKARFDLANAKITYPILKRYGVDANLENHNAEKTIADSYRKFKKLNPWIKYLPTCYYISFLLFIILGVLILLS